MTGFFSDLDRLEGAGAATSGIDEAQVDVLADLAAGVAAAADAEGIGRAVLDPLLRLTAGDGAALFLTGASGGMEAVASTGRKRDAVGVAVVPAALVERALSATRRPVTAAAAPETGAPATIVVPLESARGPLGALVVWRHGADACFGPVAAAFARLVGTQTALALSVLDLETTRRAQDRVSGENQWLRQLSRRTAAEARIIDVLNAELGRRTSELGDARAFLANILDSTTAHAIIAVDREGLVTRCSAGAVALYGLDAAEPARTLRLDSLFAEPDRADGLWERVVAAASVPGGRFEREVSRFRRDGVPVMVQTTVTAIRSSDGDILGFVDVSRDITAECAMRRQMLLSEKMASLGTLAAGIAHEFNNVLQGIIGFLEQAEIRTDAPFRERAITVSLDAARRAARLTRQLHAFARPSACDRLPTMLAELAGETCALVASSFAAEGIALERDDAAGAPASVDRSRILQVLLNLVTNARHAVQGAAQRVVTVRTGSDAACAWFAVSDTGIGIPAANLARVFEPFFTTKGALGGDVHDGKIHGTGLGLALSQGIVAEHGGTIDVESTPNVGTTFTVRLPLALARAPDADRELRPRAAVATSVLSVLVIEPDELTRDFVRHVLVSRGHAVTFASASDAPLPANLDVLVTRTVPANPSGDDGPRVVLICDRQSLPTGLPPGISAVVGAPCSPAELTAAVENLPIGGGGAAAGTA